MGAMTSGEDHVLVLTPVKDAAPHLDSYFAALARLTIPAERLSIGVLESDSTDDTYRQVQERLGDLRPRFRGIGLWKRDFGLSIPAGWDRWADVWQIPRRTVLAKARNHLLSRSLADQDWVLWLDVDVIDYPPDVVDRMIATGKDIVQPHCVRSPGGPTFDYNAWRDKGRQHLGDLRGGPDLVRLDAVGGTMLLVRADVHRDGLVFPPFLYGERNRFARDPNPWAADRVGEIETEGLGLMAKDMGHECWGMPNLEIIHPLP
jgi:hypothetical protein